MDNWIGPTAGARIQQAMRRNMEDAASATATNGAAEPKRPLTATEVLEDSWKRQVDAACSMPTFRGGTPLQPRIDVSKYLKPMEDALLRLLLTGTAATSVSIRADGALLFNSFEKDLRAARLPEPPPAKPHPLQKLSGQPNCWGQSMWRPWE